MSTRHDGRGDREAAEHRLRERAATRLDDAAAVLRQQLNYVKIPTSLESLAAELRDPDAGEHRTNVARALLALPGGAR